MSRYICIHGHFYQPPRESPWLDAIEHQPSAHPFHDWNERITEECYRPNAGARVLDDRGRIDRLVNNYARISFDVGPTLMRWLAERAPDVHEALVEADRAAIARSGYGAAIAQAHGHLILPLCNDRDRRTQVRWGVRDFELRFGRRPSGMWLPETACDTPTLEALAAEDIAFTILAPSQAARVRPKGARDWIDVRGGRVETRRAYTVRLPSGREIAVFFYDGPTSRAIAFERLLDDGAAFARRLLGLFQPATREPQLVHVATDGETYGHHHRFGEMALAYALEEIERRHDVRLVPYEAFLRAHPPTWEAEVVERTAWSCAHGVERWRSHCGCSSGAHPSWNQRWREPLRRALDALRDAVAEPFETVGRDIFVDPWAARDRYVDVVAASDARAIAQAQDRLLESTVRPEVLAQAPRRRSAEPDWVVRALSLLELQRDAMSMYTSCGWFFDDISGIETTQILAYARRVIELSRELFGRDLEPAFLEILGQARSNLPQAGDGRDVWNANVVPRSVTLERAAAHFAVASLFNDYADDEALQGFDVHFEDREVRTTGRTRLALGVMNVEVRSTRRSERFAYAVIHVGDHHLGVGVRPDDRDGRIRMRADVLEAFAEADLTRMLRALERHFPNSSYSLRSLFRDEQKRILDLVLSSTLESVESAYAAIHEQHAPLMRYLASLGQPVPEPLLSAARHTLSAAIREELARGEGLDLASLRALVAEAREVGLGRDPCAADGAGVFSETEIAAAARNALRRLVAGLEAPDADRARLAKCVALARFVVSSGLSLGHDSVQERAVVLRDRFVRDGYPDGWQPAFEALLDALGIAPHSSRAATPHAPDAA